VTLQGDSTRKRSAVVPTHLKIQAFRENHLRDVVTGKTERLHKEHLEESQTGRRLVEAEESLSLGKEKHVAGKGKQIVVRHLYR